TKLDTLNAELTAAEANRIQKEAIYRLAASRNGDALIALAASPGVSQVSSPAAAEIAILQQLRAQQNSLKMSLAHDSVAMDKNNRHIRELDTQIAEASARLLPRCNRSPASQAPTFSSPNKLSSRSSTSSTSSRAKRASSMSRPSSSPSFARRHSREKNSMRISTRGCRKPTSQPASKLRTSLSWNRPAPIVGLFVPP